MHLFSQCISVELSIHWKSGKNLFSLNEDNFCSPYLNITYRNNSEDAIYFLKISHSVSNFPELVRSGTIGRNDSTYELSNYEDYSNLQYLIRLGASPNYFNNWEVMIDTLDLNKEHEIASINDALADIYATLSNNYLDSLIEIKTHYTVSDITPDGILNILKDRFVFLRKGEIYTDTYNLVGFKVLKGCFTFFVEPNSLQAYVNTLVWDKKHLKYLEIKTLLPKTVSEYSLYSGNLNSNNITITFKKGKI